MQLNIPVRKSPQDIEFYLEQGPRFGAILKDLSIQISEGFLKSGHEVEAEFRRLSAARFFSYKSLFPFETELNTRGNPFGHACCVSVNDTVLHSRPKSEEFIPGDVVSVDCGIALKPTPMAEYHLYFDACFTTVYKELLYTLWVLRPLETLRRIARPQAYSYYGKTRDITQIIEDGSLDPRRNDRFMMSGDSNIVVSFTGHGIGYSLHEAPHIHNMNCGISDDLFDGMCICVEPIYSEPIPIQYARDIEKVYLDSDGWAVKTISGRRTTHFETVFCCHKGQLIDSIGITEW